MRVVCDIECDKLVNPSTVWVIVCKDMDSGEYHTFYPPTDNDRFLSFAAKVKLWVGHNWLEYDYPNLNRLLGLEVKDVAACSIDTLIISRLMDYSRQGGHSIEQYGTEFNYEKIKFSDFSKLSEEMVRYCQRDVDICHRVYKLYSRNISNPDWSRSILCEHRFQLVVNSLHNNGFYFNTARAETLLADVTKELQKLDKEILEAFPPKLKLIREIHPKVTKHGTLSRTDFRWVTDGDLSAFNGGPFSRCEWVPFNPSSHKQLIDVLHQAGWMPTDKTTTHIETEREIKHQKRGYLKENKLDIKDLYVKLDTLRKYGWKINEENLSTLPQSAPSPARSLAKRILYESRRRTLTEWLGLVQDDSRIHGKFLGIGTWTHRMATQKPNMQNIPNELADDKSVKLFGKELRQLWRAPKNRLLVGVDAESIQLRLLAHYIDDQEFTDALVNGKKSKKTDPHSLNQRILGSQCRSRQAAKRFIYALLLGAGLGKLAQILECDEQQAQEALDRILERYTGWARLKREDFPLVAKRGWITGLDGRKVAIPGGTAGERKHLAMSAYLQNGEALVMKQATLLWLPEVEKICPFSFVNMVHDEWQIEVHTNSFDKAKKVAHCVADSLVETGNFFKLKCPMAGSYYNEDHKEYTIGTTWYQTH